MTTSLRHRTVPVLALAVFALATIALTLTAVPALAKHGDDDNDPAHRHMHGRMGGHMEHDTLMEHRIDRMTEHLDLSEAQVAQIEAIHERHQAEMEARHEEMEAAHKAMGERMEQIHEMAAAENPDPTAIGNLVIEMRRDREAMQSRHDAVRDEVKTVLTPEQLTKFEAFHEARQEMGHRTRGRKGRSADRR